jgi:hypothetical protein
MSTTRALTDPSVEDNTVVMPRSLLAATLAQARDDEDSGVRVRTSRLPFTARVRTPVAHPRKRALVIPRRLRAPLVAVLSFAVVSLAAAIGRRAPDPEPPSVAAATTPTDETEDPTTDPSAPEDTEPVIELEANPPSAAPVATTTAPPASPMTAHPVVVRARPKSAPPAHRAAPARRRLNAVTPQTEARRSDAPSDDDTEAATSADELARAQLERSLQ